jgi:hypothetical protein
LADENVPIEKHDSLVWAAPSGFDDCRERLKVTDGVCACGLHQILDAVLPAEQTHV